MKLLMIITLGDMGGAQRHVLDVSRELTRRGHSVCIGVGGEFKDLSQAAASGTPDVEVVRLKHLRRPVRFFRDFLSLFEIIRLIRARRPDIVHCHSSKAGGIASIAGWLCRVPVVYTAHGFVFRENLSWTTRMFYLWSERIASWFRAKVITVSQSDYEAALQRSVVAKSKLITIPNGIDESLSAQLLKPDAARAQLSQWTGVDLSKNKVVVTIANLYPPKNVPTLIQAFEFVVRRIPEARLVIIGDGEQRAQCEKIIRSTDELSDKVFLIGQKVDAYKILRGADMMALASTKEGMPYTVLEAQLAGTPVVATRVGGLPEMGEEPLLHLVVPHSAEMLADAIVETLRADLRGTGALRKQFTLTGMVSAIEKVYVEAAGR